VIKENLMMEENLYHKIDIMSDKRKPHTRGEPISQSIEKINYAIK
jgi:hypothetical protein